MKASQGQAITRQSIENTQNLRNNKIRYGFNNIRHRKNMKRESEKQPPPTPAKLRATEIGDGRPGMLE